MRRIFSAALVQRLLLVASLAAAATDKLYFLTGRRQRDRARLWREIARDRDLDLEAYR